MLLAICQKSRELRFWEVKDSFAYEHMQLWQFQELIFFKLGFTPFKAEQPLQGMELQEKGIKKY